MFIVFYFPTESAVVCAVAFQCGILSVRGWQALPVVLVTSLMVYLAARRIDTIYAKQDEELKREGMTPAEKKECKLPGKETGKACTYAGVCAGDSGADLYQDWK